MTNATMAYVPGDTIPYSYNAGFIVLSYFISAVGCWTTLELLHRRTTTGGVSNWHVTLRPLREYGVLTKLQVPFSRRCDNHGSGSYMVCNISHH